MRMLSWSTTSTWGQRAPAGDGAAGRSPALHPDGALGLPARSDPFPASSSSSSSSPTAHLPFSLLLHLADHIVHDLCKRQGAGGGVSTPNLPTAPQGAHLQRGGCAGGAGTPPLLMGPCQPLCTPPGGPKTAILGWPSAATRSVGLLLGWQGCFGDLAQGVAPGTHTGLSAGAEPTPRGAGSGTQKRAPDGRGTWGSPGATPHASALIRSARKTTAALRAPFSNKPQAASACSL